MSNKEWLDKIGSAETKAELERKSKKEKMSPEDWLAARTYHHPGEKPKKPEESKEEKKRGLFGGKNNNLD